MSLTFTAKKLRCSEASPVIVDILNKTLEEDDLVKLGMILHPFADSFSHQGFSGLLSKVNDIKDCNPVPGSNIPWGWFDRIRKAAKWIFKDKFDKKFDSLMPAYGHGQAIDYPDLPYLTWSYQYDYSYQFSDSYKFSGELDNKERYKRAFEKIKKHLEDYLKKHSQYKDEDVDFQDFEILFNALLVKKTDEGREKNWRKILISKGLFEKNDYELYYKKNKWIKDAFANFEEKKFDSRKVEGAELTSKFSDSSWYHYYLAVKWYKEQFFNSCSKFGLDICR